MPDTLVREEIHHRQIDLRFYNRSDGLYEVVGQLLDTKSLPFRRQLATEDTQAGDPLHDIRVTLVIDADMRVIDATADMVRTPFDICPGAAGALQTIKGLTIGNGWNKAVREKLGGALSCTHIVELLGPMATTAFQGLAPQSIVRMNRADGLALRQKKVDSCYTYSAGREVVAQLWPDLRREDA